MHAPTPPRHPTRPVLPTGPRRPTATPRRQISRRRHSGAGFALLRGYHQRFGVRLVWFLPMNFEVVGDGHDMLWTYPGVDGMAAADAGCGAISGVSRAF